MEDILALALVESLHKRLGYLQGEAIIRLSDYIKQHGLSAPSGHQCRSSSDYSRFSGEGGVEDWGGIYLPEPDMLDADTKPLLIHARDYCDRLDVRPIISL